MSKRVRRIGSIKNELLEKSREAALAAVQIFNNPNITFKSESYTMLMIVAWTYLMHAYYRTNNIEYRYHKVSGKRRFFEKTKYGAFKHWELERCLNDLKSPIDKNTTNNLRFLIDLRHEIEHQMTTRIDDYLSAKFQACCLNYNEYIKSLFSDELGIDKHLSFSLQFSSISAEQKDTLSRQKNLPQNIESYVITFDKNLSEEEYLSQKYAYRIFFVPKTANRKGQSDHVIEFIKHDSPLAAAINKEYAVIKETEKNKYLPGQVVAIMQSEGFSKFTMYNHTLLWKAHDAKNEAKGNGAIVAGGTWYWYERWIEEVRKHCQDHRNRYQ